MEKSVVIVEDEGILLLVNTKLVEQLLYKVVGTASNGRDAIDLIKKLKPDIVIMDIKLKGEMNGIEAVKEIREFSDVPVVYITGNSESHMFESAKETNMLDFLIKPINIDMLRAALNKCVYNN